MEGKETSMDMVRLVEVPTTTTAIRTRQEVRGRRGGGLGPGRMEGEVEAGARPTTGVEGELKPSEPSGNPS